MLKKLFLFCMSEASDADGFKRGPLRFGQALCIFGCLLLNDSFLQGSVARNETLKKSDADRLTDAQRNGQAVLEARRKRQMNGSSQVTTSAAQNNMQTFSVTFPAGSNPGHWEQKMTQLTIDINESGFDPVTQHGFSEVVNGIPADGNNGVAVPGQEEFLMVVLCTQGHTGNVVLKAYEASSFAQFLENDRGNSVRAPGNIPLINSRNICCVKYHKNAPSLTYVCSWDELLPLQDEDDAHKAKRTQLLAEYLALDSFRQISQRGIGGAVVNNRLREREVVNDPVAAGGWRNVGRQTGKWLFYLSFPLAIGFLHGLLNNGLALRAGCGLQRWRSGDAPFREFVTSLGSFALYGYWVCWLDRRRGFAELNDFQSWFVCLFGLFVKGVSQEYGESYPLPGRAGRWRSLPAGAKIYDFNFTMELLMGMFNRVVFVSPA